MANYIIAGGSGFVGTHLTDLLLKEGHVVYILSTRKQVSSRRNVHFVLWDTANKTIDNLSHLGECKVINLAGAGVADKRWTPERKREIIDSRVDSLDTLYHAIQSGLMHTDHVVSASAIGYYGESNKVCIESDLSDESFLSSTCMIWEDAALKLQDLKCSLSIARIGIVLGKEGGALKEFLKPMQFRVAGIPANGQQIYSWIHVVDLCRMLYFLAENNKKGVFNAVAPEPSTVNQIFKEMIRVKNQFILKVHAPQFALKLILGEMAIEVLKSCHVSSQKIVDTGFVFQYPDISSCIQSLLKPKS